jgi:hypothetical protein
MLHFRVHNVVPPGNRYFFLVEQTGLRLEDFTMSGLLGRIRAHYAQNNITGVDISQEIVEDHMCRFLPEGFCHGTLDGRPRAQVITLQQIRQATMDLAAGNPRVAPGKARHRAAICGTCPKHDRSLCPTCVGLVSWAKRLAGASLGGLDEWLGVCTVDTTALAAKVHMTDVPDHPEYPDMCWRRTEACPT